MKYELERHEQNDIFKLVWTRRAERNDTVVFALHFILSRKNIDTHNLIYLMSIMIPKDK